jgi:S1-C subfamily serine protease
MRTIYPRRAFATIIVVALILAALWFYLFNQQRSPRDPTSVPRAITARGDLAADELTTIDIFQTAAPSVVYITSVALRRNPFSLNVYEIPRGTGSGFIWDREGRIVTNYHVIEDASRVRVTLSDGSTWKAILVGLAPDKDLAVLQISAPPEKLVSIAVGESDNLQVGQKVFAIGNPFGLDHTLTSGIVSALGREIQSITGRTIQGVIQTDAAINPGNSGGPLLDSAGRLIGVNTAIYSPSGTSAGIGFAVPVEVVNRVVPEIIRHGRVIRPGIGVSLAGERLVRRLGIEGVLIINIQSGSSAEAAGLKGTYRIGSELVLGDIIVAVEGQKVTNYDSLRHLLESYQVGDRVSLDIIRDGSSLTVQVTLEEVG